MDERISAGSSPNDAWSEDLLWQASRAIELARTLCVCEGYYHAFWPTLRLAGITDSLPYEEPVLASLIAPFIRDDARVMIGGAADPGVLCVMGRIYGSHRPKFTLIDRCRAGLELVQEFAGSKALACETLNLDLLELEERRQWDQIVLHYILDFVEPQSRERFFGNLARSLMDGGILVSAGTTATKVGSNQSRELETVFFRYSLKALQASPLADRARDPEFEQMLRGYAAAWTKRKLNVVTSKGLRELLSSAGFRILSETVVPRPQRVIEGVAIVDTRSIIVATPR